MKYIIFNILSQYIKNMSIVDAIQKIESNEIQYDTFPWNKQKTRKIQHILLSLGTIIKLYDKYFLICNYHSINYSDNISLIGDDTKYTITNNKIIIPEIDLAIIQLDEEISNIYDMIEYSHIDKLDINIKDINNKVIFDFIIPFNDMYMSLQCNIIQFTKKRYNNICFPDMPMFIAKLTKESIKKIENNINLLHGASGTPIYKNNKIYGILSGEINDDGTLILTPIFMIKRVLNEIITTGKFNGLCKSYYDVDTIGGTTFITKIYPVDYNIYNKLYGVKNTRLRKNDIISLIDENKVIDNKIFDNNLNIFIDIDTYYIINKDINSLNKILVLRPNNKDGNKHVEIITGNRDIYSCTNINILSNKIEYYIIDDKIYCEVNSELFKLLLQYRIFSDVDIVYSSLKIKYSDIFSNTKKIMLCNDLENKYCIFNNKDIKCYTYDKVVKSDIYSLSEGKLIKCLLNLKVS